MIRFSRLKFRQSHHSSVVLLALIFIFGPVVPASAKDQWVQVKSKNFFLIGNASETEIKGVATKLEQFRETFRQLFRSANLTGEVPTNVVVFKSGSSYKPFKPKRADGKINEGIAGYFQPGEDVNYITLSTEGEDADTYGLIFHEYVHFILNSTYSKSDLPQWFNEGLAEYYQTFEIEGDIKAKLGLPQYGHLQLLQQSQLMPLDTLFNISNYQLHQTGGHSRSIFYAQSWALVHYLLQSGKSEPLDKFLSLVTRAPNAEKAFQEAFQTDYKKMEGELKKYVAKNSYKYNQVTFKNKLSFDTEMTATPLSEAETGAYLGDLLYHTQRADDAEAYLAAALKLQPDSSMANTTLAMVKVKQRKWDEARLLLEKVIATDPKNHIAYYRYAFLLSREGRDEFGFVQAFSPTTAGKIRQSLRKAIALNPKFTESYELLAFVNLVNNEELDDAVTQLKIALKHRPGNQRYLLRIAEVFSRQSKFVEAGELAEKLARSAEDDEMRSRVQNLLTEIAQRKDFSDRNAAEKGRYEAAIAGNGAGGPPRIIRRIERGKPPTEAEIAKLRELAELRSINESLRPLGMGDQRVLGQVLKIDCKTRPLLYTVRSGSETFTLSSVDFSGLTLNSFDAAAASAEVGCDANISGLTALVTFRISSAPKSAKVRGELIAIEFVPAKFRILTDEEMKTPAVFYESPGDEVPTVITSGMPAVAEMERERQKAMMSALSEALRKPANGQVREFGYLDQIECKGKSFIFHMRTATQTLRLLNPTPESLPIRVFTPDLEGMRFGCGNKAVEFPAVFVYSPKADAKSKTAGEIIGIDFVPKTFILR